MAALENNQRLYYHMSQTTDSNECRKISNTPIRSIGTHTLETHKR